MIDRNIFIWNDNPNDLDNWANIALGESGFSKKETSSSNNLKEVLDKYFQSYFDFVLLDVMNENSNSKDFGLSIAKAIRKQDPLVPIVLVTSNPANVYKLMNIDQLDLSGVYHDSVMAAGVFYDVAVRESLSRWFTAFPEHVIVRRCAYEIEQAFKDADEKTYSVMSSLKDSILQLPFSNSVDAWHKQLTSYIQQNLQDFRFDNTYYAYKEIVGLFQDADPYYMAANLGRRHISHNIQVFLMGVIFLLTKSDLRQYAINDLKEILGHDNDCKALSNSLLLWACISTTHDVGYLSQYMDKVTSDIVRIAELFKKAIDEDHLLEPPQASKWCDLHHSEVGWYLWLSQMPNELPENENKFFERIADAIASHHPIRNRRKNKYSEKEWATFLLILCDELQDWHRDKHEALPGNDRDSARWRIFTLSGISANSDMSNSLIVSVDLVAKDYDPFIRHHIDIPGTNAVSEKFNNVLGTLYESLLFKSGCVINLSAEFVSRKIDPVIKSKNLPKS